MTGSSCDTPAPVDWARLPDVLEVADLRQVLRLGRDGAYQWMREHPGLVIRSGSAKRVPREGLRRFLERDPAVMALAFTDPYSRRSAEPVRGAHLKVAQGGR